MPVTEELLDTIIELDDSGRPVIRPGDADAEPDVIKVGPKGYTHGWHFVGVPDSSTLPSEVEAVSFDDVLSPKDAAKFRSIVNNDKMRLGSKAADELDTLKGKAIQGMLERNGVPEHMAKVIAGLPEESRFSQQSLQTDGLMTNAVNAIMGRWVLSGDSAKKISDDYDRVMAMKNPPEVKPHDFDGGLKTEVKHYQWGDEDREVTETRFHFNDMSPEAQARRNEASLYYAMKAQRQYTQQVLREAEAYKGSDSIPVTRFVYGKYGGKLLEAAASGKPWEAEVNRLSSWAEPTSQAKGSIKRFIQAGGGEWGYNPAWLSSSVSKADIFYHWRGEGELRKASVVGEVTPVNENGLLKSSGVTVSKTMPK